MSYVQLLNTRADYIRRTVAEYRKRLERLPSGSIRCYNTSGYEKFFYKSVNPGEAAVYLKKSELDRAALVAERGYYEAMIDDLEAELESIDYFLSKREDLNFPPGALYLERPGIQRLLAPMLESKDEAVRQFLAQDYTPAAHQENRRYKCKNGLLVRSKSENEIADGLYSCGLPFLYEFPFPVNDNGRDITLRPDFTILEYMIMKIKIWEHFGMMADPEYVANATRKMRLYAGAGFYPDENLIMTFESPNHLLSSIEVYDKIEKNFITSI